MSAEPQVDVCAIPPDAPIAVLNAEQGPMPAVAAVPGNATTAATITAIEEEEATFEATEATKPAEAAKATTTAAIEAVLAGGDALTVPIGTSITVAVMQADLQAVTKALVKEQAASAVERMAHKATATALEKQRAEHAEELHAHDITRGLLAAKKEQHDVMRGLLAAEKIITSRQWPETWRRTRRTLLRPPR